MKITLVLFISIISFHSFSQKNEPLKLLFIDGYTNLPMDNYDIDFTLNNRDLKGFKTLNSEGMCILKGFNGNKVKLKAETNDKKFYSINLDLKFNQYKNGIITVYFYPTPLYEEQMYAIEDSIYGPVVYDFNKPIIEVDNIIEEGDAQFIGGPDSLQMFISSNVNYPQPSIEMNEQGNCLLFFVVEKDGKITHVKVGKGVSFDIDNEAKRLMRSSPNWKPGEEDNIIHRTLCRLPINFTLN